MEELSKKLFRFKKQLEVQVGEIQDSESQIVTNIDWYEDLEGQTTIVVEISDTSWQEYVINLCRKILASFFDDPYLLALIVVPIESIGETKGSFSLTYRGSVNTFFVSYYPDERLRSNPFTVPIYYRKFIDSLQIIRTEQGISLERAETIWKRLFPAAYETLAITQGIRTFSEKHLATSFRNFLLQNIDLIEDIAKAKNEELPKLVKPQDVAPLPKPLERKVMATDQEYSIASRSPSAVWISSTVIDRRIDAHPFQPLFFEVDKLLSERDDVTEVGKKLRHQRGISGGATPRGARYVDETQGVRFIRTQNITQNWIDLSEVVYISHEDHQTLERSALEKDDVLLTITGALFGQSAVVYPECLPANISQHSVRMHFIESVNPRFVAAFLNCKFGQSQIQMHKVGATRSAIDYEGIRAIKMPIPPKAFQEHISALVQLAERCRREAKRLFYLATSLSFPTIDKLSDSQNPKIFWVSIKSLTTHRMDVKYYLPKFLAIDDFISENYESYGYIKDWVQSIVNGVEYRDYVESGQPYLTVSNINKGKLNVKDAPKIPFDASVSSKGKVKRNDVIVVRTGSIGQAAYIRKPEEDAILSSHFIRLRLNDPSSGPFIAFYLDSEIGKKLQERISYGAVQPQIGQDLLLELPIPTIEESTREEIAKNIELSFALQDYSDEILNQVNSEIEALIEGTLVIEAFISGQIKPITWEDILQDIGS